MISLFAPIGGLGAIHYLAPIVGLDQARLVVRQKNTFGNIAFIALGGVAADISCLIAWLVGEIDPHKGHFWVELLMALVPLPFATACMLWVKKNRTINMANAQIICSDEKSIFNPKIAMCLIPLFGVYFLYAGFGFPERLAPCSFSSGSCGIEDVLFGDRHFTFSQIGLTAAMIAMFGSALILNLRTVYLNRNSK